MFKHYIKIFIILIAVNTVRDSFAQNLFHKMMDDDSLYRFNTSFKSLDSLLTKNNGFNLKSDTSFYNSYSKTEVIDLDQMLYFAIKNNPKLKAMKYKIDAERIRAEESNYLPDPKLEAEGDYISTDFKSVREINFYASQDFPYPGKLTLQKKSILNSADILEQEHHSEEVNIINEIKNNYYDLYFNAKKLEVNLENQLIAKNINVAAEIKYSSGKGMQQEVFKAQIEQSKLKNEEYILTRERTNILSKLTELTKIEINENTNIISFRNFDADYIINSESFNLQPSDLDRLVKYAFEYRPDLKAIKNKIIQNKTGLEISEISRYPDFNLKLGYRILPFEQHNGFNIMIGLTIPFAPWSAGKYDYKTQRSEINIKLSNEEYESKRNEIQNEIRTALNNLLTSKEVINYYYNILIPQTENSLKSVQYSYENNMASFPDILDSYRVYQQARLMFFESMYNYLKVIAGLEKATGMNLKSK